MIKKVLIANRGEIAVRIIRACREMGIRTVAVYSEADKNSLHKTLADEAICIGPAASSKSYLNMKAILEAACLTGADSIHPGFGFLSENASFAKICNDMGIKFIGPSGDLINLLGNKSKAKETMKKAGVPVVPGSEGLIKNKEEAIELAEKIKYPVILKASAGGGGRGIRIAYSKEELEKSYDIVKQEAKISFGDDSIYLEKFIENPRHVEIQILADEYGNCIHLGERDCSIQRRNQKIIEETPSMAINDKTRKKMGQVAVKAVKEIGYTNVGTIEFLVDKNQDFYFMEMNTRIQVEHPVTEWVTGIDLIKAQIRIADGEKLKWKQEDIQITGHAIECRINAEDPSKNFRPCPGRITDMYLPGGKGVRIDSAIYSGCEVSPYYDSMITKLIVFAATRKEAIAKMHRALGEVIIEGITTNIDFLYEIMERSDYQEGDFTIQYLEKVLEERSQEIKK